MPGVNKSSERYREARESLPDGLREVFDELVEQYAFYTEKHYGVGYVAYKVIAELVRDGWRQTKEQEAARGR